MQRPVAITAVVIAALASWTCSRRAPNEQAMIEDEVANGWTLRNDAVPSTLTEAERKAFALVPDATYLKPDLPPEEWYADWQLGMWVGTYARLGRSGPRVRCSQPKSAAAMSKAGTASACLTRRKLRSAPSTVSHRL